MEGLEEYLVSLAGNTRDMLDARKRLTGGKVNAVLVSLVKQDFARKMTELSTRVDTLRYIVSDDDFNRLLEKLGCELVDGRLMFKE